MNRASRLICSLLVVLASSLPGYAEAQLQSGDLVIGVGRYPQFDAGFSSGALHLLRAGSILEPLDSYTTWSQGPHDLINGIVVVGDMLVFDREEGLGFLDDERLAYWHMSKKVSSFVRDRGGRLYVASGYGTPVLERFSVSGESAWMTTLSQLGQGWALAMDLARDQCTLWYSRPWGPGIFLFDVCRRVDGGRVSSAPASAIRLLDDGTALVALSAGIARMDVSGAVRAIVPYRLPESASGSFVSLSVSEDLTTFWVAEGTRGGDSVVYQRRLADFELVVEYPVPRELGVVSSVTVVPDWRAAAAPIVRRHPIRRALGD